jgi:pimeloyl-ACP methyl ester carboxylesterase
MTIKAIRTSDERFADLTGFPYQPRYFDDLPGYAGLRMAVIDEGARDAPVALLLHGEPTWSYLYRKMIPPFLSAGYRCVAPDLFGFGRSDKPIRTEDQTYGFQCGSLLALIDRLDLRRVLLVVQDWGGILGLSLPMAAPERFEKLFIMNTGLPVEPEMSLLAADVFSGEEPKSGFAKWRALACATPDLPVGAIVQAGSDNQLSDEEVAAYDAPFPDASYKAGPHILPARVPLRDDMEGYAEGREALKFLNKWNGPVFMAVGTKDRVIRPKAMQRLAAEIGGCPEPMLFEDGSHFLQELGTPLAQAALDRLGPA